MLMNIAVCLFNVYFKLQYKSYNSLGYGLILWATKWYFINYLHTNSKGQSWNTWINAGIALTLRGTKVGSELTPQYLSETITKLNKFLVID